MLETTGNESASAHCGCHVVIIIPNYLLSYDITNATNKNIGYRPTIPKAYLRY